jgi:hypothetical protein
MPILFLFLFLVFLAGIFGAALVLPIWTIVHCLSDETRSKRSKIVWVVLMFLVWPFTSFCYGIFASKKKAMQLLSGTSLVLSILFLGGIIFGLTYSAKMLRAEIPRLAEKLNRINTADITDTQRQQIKENLLALRDELTMRISELNTLHKAASLVQLYGIYTKDNTLTVSEYNDWINKFESRSMLDRRELDNYIRKRRYSP